MSPPESVSIKLKSTGTRFVFNTLSFSDEEKVSELSTRAIKIFCNTGVRTDRETLSPSFAGRARYATAIKRLPEIWNSKGSTVYYLATASDYIWNYDAV